MVNLYCEANGKIVGPASRRCEFKSRLGQQFFRWPHSIGLPRLHVALRMILINTSQCIITFRKSRISLRSFTFTIKSLESFWVNASGYIHTHAQFNVTMFDNLSDIPDFPKSHYAVWRMRGKLFTYQTNSNISRLKKKIRDSCKDQSL